LGTSTNRTFIPLERINSRGSAATADDAMNTNARLLAAIKQPICIVMCREYSEVMFGRQALCMLATGFDLCQGVCGIFGCKVAYLAAGVEHVASPTFADKHIEACVSHDDLKLCNVA